MVDRHVVGLAFSSLFSRIAKFLAPSWSPVFQTGLFFARNSSTTNCVDFHRFRQEGLSFACSRLPCIPATAPQEVFFAGKPYLEETGQFLFLFRHYDPELARWTTADPSGFPDGANNLAYMAVPTSEFDWQRLKSVAWVVAWTSRIDSAQMAGTYNELQASFHIVRQGFVTQDSQTAGTPGATHYLDDGDSFDFFSVGSSFDFASSSISAYDRIYLRAHGNSENGHFFIGEQSFPREMVLGFSENIFMLQGCGNGYIETHELVLQHFYPSTRDYLRDSVE
jgi:RHS repeat-associated protein